MKITIANTSIQETVQKLGRLLSAKSTLPILSGVLVEATADCIVFSASDGHESVIHRILLNEQESVIEQGRSVFPRELFESAKKMKGIVTIVAEDESVTVSQSKTNLNFAVMDANEYPRIDSESRDIQVILSGSEFSEIVSRTTFATSKSDTRPILTAVHMAFSKEGNVFTATDSHRLSAIHAKGTPNIENSLSLAVPSPILDKALKTFDLSRDVILLPSDNTIALANGNTILYSRLLEGNYPDTSRLIPTEFESELVVSKQELIDGLELLSAVTTNNVVAITVGELFIELSASGTGKKGTKELAFELYEGAGQFNIAFSAQYVLDVLKRLDSKSVRFKFTGAMRPFLICPESEDQTNTQLVLPVRQY